jgi:FkbM family methyltransferase
MMTLLLKRIAARLSPRWQQELKRLHFGRKIRSSQFRTAEPEYDRLTEFVGEGDWVLDVGANVGHYTARLSELVGETGRVIAFEPVPDTFELLAANAGLFRHRNVTLMNTAASAQAGIGRMHIAHSGESGLEDFYTARITESGRLAVLCMAVDGLDLPHAIRLIKIDAEGHELPALYGMRDMLGRDRPVLIVEDDGGQAVTDFLAGLGYRCDKMPGSSNLLFLPDGGGTQT